jgi:conjugal transfer pilus assembly protein TraL
MDYEEIPNRLDDPPVFLWWDFDVAMLFMSFLMFGIITEHVLLFVAIGMLLCWQYRKSKFGKHKAFGMHLMYWYLPMNFGMRLTPPSCIRRFIG